MFEHDVQIIANHDVSAFLAGDDDEAKTIVAKLSAELGFTPVDVGGVRQARLLESLGDFIRLLITDKGMGAFANISASILPQAKTKQLGGRQASNFH